jgi:hypothetical protein
LADQRELILGLAAVDLGKTKSISDGKVVTFD